MSGQRLNPEDPAGNPADAEVLAASRRLTRRSFAAVALGAAAGYGLYRWVDYSASDGMQPLPRRRAFQANAELSRQLFNERALAPTYPVSRAGHLRINGLIGIKQALLPESWRLQLVGAANEKSFPQYVPDVTAWTYEYSRGVESTEGDHFTFVPPEPVLNRIDPIQKRAGEHSGRLEEASHSSVPVGTPGLLLTMPDITKLPAHELVTEFKCVEGWSQIAHWRGVRMADFLDAYPPASKPDGSLPRYVYMETPNGGYYVGYDMAVCRHPQTLLVTEMAGKPLTQLRSTAASAHADQIWV